MKLAGRSAGMVQRLVRPCLRRGALAVVLCGVLPAAMPAMTRANGGRRESAAREIFQLTNADRARHGLAPLEWNDGLARAAEAHMRWMLDEGRLSHQYAGEALLPERVRVAGVAFSKVAENLAAAFSAKMVENGWMHSPPHRRNILDPELNSLGVVAQWYNGRLYAVEDFAHVVAALDPAQVEERVGELLRKQGIDPDGPRAAAEAACHSKRGVPAGVRLVVRYQTSHVGRLPEELVKELRQGHYARASVGACAPEGAQGGFATFRVAILLY